MSKDTITSTGLEANKTVASINGSKPETLIYLLVKMLEQNFDKEDAVIGITKWY